MPAAAPPLLALTRASVIDGTGAPTRVVHLWSVTTSIDPERIRKVFREGRKLVDCDG